MIVRHICPYAIAPLYTNFIKLLFILLAIFHDRSQEMLLSGQETFFPKICGTLIYGEVAAFMMYLLVQQHIIN